MRTILILFVLLTCTFSIPTLAINSEADDSEKFLKPIFDLPTRFRAEAGITFRIREVENWDDLEPILSYYQQLPIRPVISDGRDNIDEGDIYKYFENEFITVHCVLEVTPSDRGLDCYLLFRGTHHWDYFRGDPANKSITAIIPVDTLGVELPEITYSVTYPSGSTAHLTIKKVRMVSKSLDVFVIEAWVSKNTNPPPIRKLTR